MTCAEDEGTEDDDTLVLSSGREIYAHRGIIGIGCDRGEEICISEGYDGTICRYSGGVTDPDELALADMVEISDIMIARWESCKAKLVRWAETQAGAPKGKKK